MSILFTFLSSNILFLPRLSVSGKVTEKLSKKPTESSPGGKKRSRKTSAVAHNEAARAGDSVARPFEPAGT